MKLSPHEVGQPLWQKLKEHWEEKLSKLRARIENPTISEAERIKLAWRIYTIKECIALGEPERKQETDPDT